MCGRGLGRVELLEIAECRKIDVLLISETFLKPSKDFRLPHYSIYGDDCETHGGGVAILCKTYLDHMPTSISELKCLEASSIVANLE